MCWRITEPMRNILTSSTSPPSFPIITSFSSAACLLTATMVLPFGLFSCVWTGLLLSKRESKDYSVYGLPERLTKVSLSILEKSLLERNQLRPGINPPGCRAGVPETHSGPMCWWAQNWKRKAIIILRQVFPRRRYWLFVCGERFGKFN